LTRVREGWPVRRAAVVIALVVAAGCGDDAPAPVAERPRTERVPAVAPSPDAPAVTVFWGLDDPARAARLLERRRAVEATTVLGRGVAVLRATTDARGRVVERVRAGYGIPLDVLAVDPRAYARTVPEAAGPLRSLRRGRALLSRTASRLRGVGRGGVLTLTGGRRLRVAGVIDDDAVRDAEVVISRADRRVPTQGVNVLAVLRPDAQVRPRALARTIEPGATGRLLLGGGSRRGGLARPAELKARFGEPAVALPIGSDWIRLDPAFLQRHIVTRRVPVLGTVTCHRAMMAPLRAAMGELRRRGLERLVDRGDYAGCYAPRRIRPGGNLSLHAWGLAVDLNASANPFGGDSGQDPRLVRAMERHGFTWGGDWPTTPDPMHFELRRPVER
jgi:D-alanyl-D-alanine carboxypeptidase